MKRARRAAAVEKKGKVTLRAFIEGDYWTKKLRLRKDGGSDKRRILKTWAPLLDRPLDAITSDQIERILADKRHTGGAASTLRREWGCLRNLLGYAWKSKVIPMMPVVGLPEPLVGFLHASRVRYVNERGDDEGERLFAALATREAVMDKDEDARMVVFVARLALATGMRRSEILGLRDSEIGHDVITIPGHRTKKGRVRIISLNNRARAALAMWKTRSPKGEFFPDHQDDRGWPGKSYSKWCGRLYRAWIDLCADAGIDGKTFHVHDLRHTFATRLRMVGAPLEVVRDALGHKDLASTQIYAHVGPSEVANAVALLTEE
jgi:integrase